MNFTDAIRNIPEIAHCLKNGLQALGGNSNKIKVRTKRDLKGSINIDTCLQRIYPNEPRWDYVLGYKDRVFYVEVHPADNTRKVREITAKLGWLRQWRRCSANSLDNMEGKSSYHWISTGKTYSSIKRGKYRLLLAKNGIRGPDPVLHADSIS